MVTQFACACTIINISGGRHCYYTFYAEIYKLATENIPRHVLLIIGVRMVCKGIEVRYYLVW